MALFLIFIVPLAKDVQDLLICFITADSQCLELFGCGAIFHFTTVAGILQDTENLDTGELAAGVRLVPLFIQEVSHPVGTIPFMYRHIINQLQDFPLSRVDFIFLDWRTFPVHEPAVHKMVAEPYWSASI